MRMMLYTIELPMKSVPPWRQYHPMLNKMTEKKMPPSSSSGWFIS
jgi:hypothetical protein